MSDYDESKNHKLQDINQIEFGNNVDEISSSLQMILTLYEIDDDPEIIGACKQKLEEGGAVIKRIRCIR